MFKPRKCTDLLKIRVCLIFCHSLLLLEELGRKLGSRVNRFMIPRSFVLIEAFLHIVALAWYGELVRKRFAIYGSQRIRIYVG